MDLAIAIEEIRSGAEYRLNKSVPPNQVILEWRGPGEEPTQQELENAWQVYSERFTAEEEAAATLKANIKAIAQSAVGVALNDLTQGQIKALIAVMLYNQGGVEDDMTIRALGEWVQKEDEEI